MRTFVSGLTIATACCFAASGQAPLKAIVWGGDANCGFKSQTVTSPETVRCTSIATERGPVSSITYQGITIAAAFLEDGDQLIVSTKIINRSDEVVSFDSDDWVAMHYKRRTDPSQSQRPIASETSIPTRAIIRGMSRAGRLEDKLGEVMADTQMTAETRRVVRPDGTAYIRTTIVPDKAAQEAEARRVADRKELLTNDQRRIRDSALTGKFVRAGSSVAGLVYFNRHKKADFVIYNLTVGDTNFVFNVPKLKK